MCCNDAVNAIDTYSTPCTACASPVTLHMRGCIDKRMIDLRIPDLFDMSTEPFSDLLTSDLPPVR